MTTTRARIAVTISFIIMSIVGAVSVYFSWSRQNVAVATSRCVLFVVIVACVHLAGYMLYAQQDCPQPAEAVSQRAPFEFSPLYWPALKFGVVLQLVFGMLAVLNLDTGESVGFFKVAFLGHWVGILLIMARRPLSPTKVDIFFIRWGI